MPVLESLVVVDSQTRSRDALAFAFERDGCAVHATHDAREAFALAETRVPQVVVATMAAGIDVSGLMATLRASRRSRDIPALVIGDADSREAIRSAGADDFLARPAFLRDVVTMARLLAARHEGEERADLTDFDGLLGLSRALHFARRSGVLTVERRGRQGALNLREGELVEARVGRQSGANAFHQMLLWESGGLTFSRIDEANPDRSGGPVRSIHKPTERLLDDGARFLTQFDEIAANMGGRHAIYRMEARQLVELKRQLPAEVMPLVERFDGRRTIAEIVEESSFKPFDALLIVYRLSELGAIALRAPGASVSGGTEWLAGGASGEEVAVASELRRLTDELHHASSVRERLPIAANLEPSDAKLVGRPPAAPGHTALRRRPSDRTPPPIPIDAPRAPSVRGEEMGSAASPAQASQAQPILAQAPQTQLPPSQLPPSQSPGSRSAQPLDSAPDSAPSVDGSIDHVAAIEPRASVVVANFREPAVELPLTPPPSAALLAPTIEADSPALSLSVERAAAVGSEPSPAPSRSPVVSATPSPVVVASVVASPESTPPVEEVRRETGRRRKALVEAAQSTARHRRATGPHPKAAVDDSRVLTNRAARQDTGRIKKSPESRSKVEAPGAESAAESQGRAAPISPAAVSGAEAGAGSRGIGDEAARPESTGRHRRARLLPPSVDAAVVPPSERRSAELPDREAGALPSVNVREPARRDATGPKPKLGFDALEEDFFAREADLTKIDAIDNFDDLGEPASDEPRGWFGKRPPGHRRH